MVKLLNISSPKLEKFVFGKRFIFEIEETHRKVYLNNVFGGSCKRGSF